MRIAAKFLAKTQRDPSVKPREPLNNKYNNNYLLYMASLCGQYNARSDWLSAA